MSTSPGPLYIAVCGSAAEEEPACSRAEEIGRLLAQQGAVVLSGGLTGVMEAVCRGARSEGGLTVGLLPSADRTNANRYVDVAIPLGLGEVRNALLIRACDAVIALTGEYGTLSEIGFALKIGKPVIGIDTWQLSNRGERLHAITEAASPQEAVERALAAAAEQVGSSPECS
ncbi:MAG: TIGR00725 family protein [Actinomycetota bacterium]|nr:TIGR00725 family protein [Actinomycetota bacterium]